MIQTLIGAVVLAAVSLFSGSIIGSLKVGPSDVDHSSKLAHVLSPRACVSQTLALDSQVRGLKASFPSLPGEKVRQTFDGQGNNVTYKIGTAPEAVADFYSQESSKYCLKKVSGDNLVFNDGGNLAVKVSPVRIDDKSTLVAYEFGTVAGQQRVLGISSRRGTLLAQTEGGTYIPPPSGDSGSYSPPPSGGTYTPPPTDSGSYVPPSGGTYMPPPEGQYQPPSGSPYPGGQYPTSGQYQSGPYPGTQPYPSGQPYPSNTNQPGGVYPNQQYPTGTNQQPSQGQFMPMQPGPTCRVNGVEMPGPCANYEGSQSGQYQQGYNQGMPQGGMMGGQYGGPQGPGMQQGQGQQGWGEGKMGSDEERQKFEEQMQQRMNEERLQQMKRGINDFSKGVKQMKKGIGVIEKKLKSCGAKLPIELMNALSAADGVVEKLKAVENPEDFDPTDLEDIGSVMQEWGPRMGDLTRICGMLKQAERESKIYERAVVRFEQRAKANKKIDVSELIAAFKEEVSKLKEALAKVKEQMSSDPATALEMLEDEFFGQMDNVRNAQQALEMALNVAQGLKDAQREIVNLGRQISALKKKKVDTSEAEGLLATMKSQVQEVRQLVAQKGFDVDTFEELVRSAFETREQLFELLQKLGSGPQYVPLIKGDSRYNVKFKLPEGFERSSGPQGMGEQGGFGAPNGSQGPSFGPSF